MNIKIDKSIMNTTDNCSRDFTCLSSDESSICEIESFVGDTILFIRDKEPKLCYYLMTFGYSYMCLCPVRRAIYKKYGI